MIDAIATLLIVAAAASYLVRRARGVLAPQAERDACGGCSAGCPSVDDIAAAMRGR